MAEELKGLLDRIHRDGVEKADSKASEIIANARKEAESILAESDAMARQTRIAAEKDAAVSVERGRKALEQAARDVILSVAGSLSRILDRVVTDEVKSSMDTASLQAMIIKVVETYAAAGMSGGIEVLVAAGDRERLQNLVLSAFRKAVAQGVKVETNERLAGGFQLSVKDGKVCHDFSSEAIAESLCQLVRPRLAEIVRSAMAEKNSR